MNSSLHGEIRRRLYVLNRVLSVTGGSGCSGLVIIMVRSGTPGMTSERFRQNTRL